MNYNIKIKFSHSRTISISQEIFNYKLNGNESNKITTNCVAQRFK